MNDDTGFHLDARQRAMLEEMHIKVWLPKAPAPVLTTAPAVASGGQAPKAAAESGAAPPPESPVKSKSIANNDGSTRAAGTFDSKKQVDASFETSHPSVAADIAQMTWPALMEAVAMCRACKLCESRKSTVFGMGQPPAAPELAPRADWLIVGEAPGENEDLQGEPFVGQAGQLLDNMLKAMALERHRNVFITNVLKCRPPANRNPEPAEVARCLPFLQRQIELLQPKVILAMGRFAVQALLQTAEPIGKLRGSPHQYHGVPVIVTYHPAYLLRSLPDKAKAWADLCLALEVMKNATPSGAGST